MSNIGEEIVGEYLKVVKGCEFIEYNLYTPDIQGEIDVIGINLKKKTLYVCEVATHLVTGLQYVKGNSPDNVNRFLKKFRKNIPYTNKHFPDYEKHFMLWSPIVKNQNIHAKHNQFRDVNEIRDKLKKEYACNLELVINHAYKQCLDELRSYANIETKELKSPVLRLMQIEEKLSKHLERLSEK
jgi:hypothetical protein